jgi:drug/metabolite transporter (DMT)-like permease
MPQPQMERKKNGPALSGGKMVRTYSVLALFLGLRAFGNLSLAWGTKHVPEVLSLNPIGYLRAMLHPFVALGIVMLTAALLARLALLSLADLSFVLPTTSIGYALSALFGKIFLQEPVNAFRWAGVALVVAGAVLVGTAAPDTTRQGNPSQ